MAIRPFTADDALVGDGAQGQINHHQLTVIAANTADFVRFAGGWVYDRAGAGWAVNVVVEDCGDVRPLTMLGAKRLDADAESVLRRIPRNGSLAVSATVLRADAHLRTEVLELRARGVAEVTLWGEQWPAELGRPIEPISHRLSLAAQAFKGHALAAAAGPSADSEAPSAVAATETLFDLAAGEVRPLYSV
ncbi:hypothetical protein [Mycobacterium deserti]|uniref:Uncharacterized protein n=1 Tax=Mycobacterium deserti TaxID=2978347 RepID=A0ABT2MAR0_9MYCO|nr:hypothetical protein [Mycobacterium deserti]MCT7659357.1 hypothetical protein [Mycobacterium deserti]